MWSELRFNNLVVYFSFQLRTTDFIGNYIAELFLSSSCGDLRSLLSEAIKGSFVPYHAFDDFHLCFHLKFVKAGFIASLLESQPRVWICISCW